MNNQKNIVLSYRGFIYYCNILQMNMPYFQLIKAFLKIQQDCFKNFQILNQDQFLNPQLNKSLISRLHFTHLQNSQQQTQLPSFQYTIKFQSSLFFFTLSLQSIIKKQTNNFFQKRLYQSLNNQLTITSIIITYSLKQQNEASLITAQTTFNERYQSSPIDDIITLIYLIDSCPFSIVDFYTDLCGSFKNIKSIFHQLYMQYPNKNFYSLYIYYILE